MGNSMSECHRLDKQSGSLLIGTMTLRPLSFLSEWVLIRSCGRVVLRLSLQRWTVISLQWKYSSWSWAIHHIWNWTKKGKSRQLNYSEIIYTMLLCVPLYENCSFLRSLGWSEREQKPLVQVFCSIQETQCTLLDWSSHIHFGLPFGHFGFSWKNDQSTTLPPTG